MAKGFLDQYADKTGGGKPSTEKERDFIIDFLSSTGRAPTTQELAANSLANPVGRDTKLTPGSTTYDMGYNNMGEYWDALASGYSYGPWEGTPEGGRRSLVPLGGVVATERGGKPLGRAYGQDISKLRWGNYVPNSRNPMGSEQPFSEQDFAGLFGAPENQFYQDTKPFKWPSIEEALAKSSPEQVYQARLEDYTVEYNKYIDDIQRAMQKDYEDAFTQVQSQLTAAEITPELAEAMFTRLQSTYSGMINNWEKQRGDFEDQKAAAYQMIGQGTYAEDLPFLKELEGKMGPSVNKLVNQYIGNAQAEYQRQQPPEMMGGQMPDMRTGTEQRDFINFVDNRGFSPEITQFLGYRFEYYYDMWLRSGMTLPFIDWLKDNL